MKRTIIFLLSVLFLCPPGFAQNTQSQPVQEPKDFDNGLKVALEATKEFGLVEDPAKVKRLNDIGYRVARRAAPNIKNFSFRIVKMEEPNAFALPGGFIFVTTGMLDLDLTDDELAALLGHEITHVKNDHIRKMSKRQTLMNLLYQAVVLGVALGIKDDNSGYNPVTGTYKSSPKTEILQGTTAFGMIFEELLLRGFSRDLEMEADHEGMIAAAGAGFSAKGTTQLFDKMRQRMYEAPGYGYWRTHPYLEDRVAMGRVWSASVEQSKNPPDDAEFRQQTQKLFLNVAPHQKEPEAKAELERMALQAFPTGAAAETLRWKSIEELEAKAKKQEPFFRDYGKLISLIQRNLTEIRSDVVLEVEPKQKISEQHKESDFERKLDAKLGKIKKEKEEALPLYEQVLSKGNFDTEMLRRFISNFPESSRLPEVRYRLAENNRILQKNTEAVTLYLEVMKTENEWKAKSLQSLRQLIPKLDDLSACYKIASESKNPELETLASDRLKMITASFKSLQNGYDFRKSYPGSAYEKPVLAQMTKLASEALNQGRLYQAVGEYQKALDQYNQILRYCPDLPVADQVKETIVSFQDLQSSKG
jgi:predicted Zn-dependent protease